MNLKSLLWGCSIVIVPILSGCNPEAFEAQIGAFENSQEPPSEEAPSPSPPSNPPSGPSTFSRVVSVGYGGRRITSDDGYVWENNQLLVSQGSAGGDDDDNLRGVGFGDGLFVAVGGSSLRRVLTSPDGVTWTHQNFGYTGWMGDVAYTNNIYFAGGGNGIHMIGTRSPETTGGIQWKSYSPYSIQNSDVDHLIGGGSPVYNTHMRRIAAGNGLFVAVGDSGRRSVTDGSENNEGRLQWISHQWSGTVRRDVAFGNNIFVAVGDSGLREYSTDGIQWNTSNDQQGWAAGCASIPSGTSFRRVIWTGSEFVTISNNSGGQLIIAKSLDGQSWTWHPFSQQLKLIIQFKDEFFGLNGWSTPTIYRGVETPGIDSCGYSIDLISFSSKDSENQSIWSDSMNIPNDMVIGDIPL